VQKILTCLLANDLQFLHITAHVDSARTLQRDFAADGVVHDSIESCHDVDDLSRWTRQGWGAALTDVDDVATYWQLLQWVNQNLVRLVFLQHSSHQYLMRSINLL